MNAEKNASLTRQGKGLALRQDTQLKDAVHHRLSTLLKLHLEYGDIGDRTPGWISRQFKREVRALMQEWSAMNERETRPNMAAPAPAERGG